MSDIEIRADVRYLAAPSARGRKLPTVVWIVLGAAVLIGAFFFWIRSPRSAPSVSAESSLIVPIAAAESRAPDPSTAPGAEGGPPNATVVKASEDAADAAAAAARRNE